LTSVGVLVEAGMIETTLTEDLGRICAVHLREAYRCLEAGRVIGKLTLTGF